MSLLENKGLDKNLVRKENVWFTEKYRVSLKLYYYDKIIDLQTVAIIKKYSN